MDDLIWCIIFIAITGGGAIAFIIFACRSRRNRSEKLIAAAVLALLCATFFYILFRDANEQPGEEPKEELDETPKVPGLRTETQVVRVSRMLWARPSMAWPYTRLVEVQTVRVDPVCESLLRS